MTLSNLTLSEGMHIPMVNWKGSLATIMCDYNENRVETVYVWVFDDGEMMWNLIRTFGPIELKVGRFLQCSKNGKIMGECLDGKLFVVDHVTGCVKMIEIDEARICSYESYGYSESLAFLKGMELVVVKKEEEKEVDEDEEEDGPVAGKVDIAGFFMSYLQLHGSEVVGSYPLEF